MAVPDQGKTIDAVCDFLIIGSVLATCLRFLSRKLSGSGFWWDDWFALAALVRPHWRLLSANIWRVQDSEIRCVCRCYSPSQLQRMPCCTQVGARSPHVSLDPLIVLLDVHNGFGKHAIDAPMGTNDFLHTLFFKEIVYNISITLCKISVLFFYRRTFAITRTMQICLWTLGIIFVGWFLSMTFTVIFMCQPVQKAWKPDLPGHCANLYAFFLGQAIPNIVTDVVLLLLPLPYLWRLQIQLPQKIALVSVFLLGYL